jgi:hypothetical protein
MDSMPPDALASAVYDAIAGEVERFVVDQSAPDFEPDAAAALTRGLQDVVRAALEEVAVQARALNEVIEEPAATDGQVH